MKNNSSGEDSSRRDFLQYSGLVGFVGFTGFTGLNLGSESAIAAPTGTPSIADGIFAGEHQVSSYDIEYQNLDTSSDIEITYIFTDSSNTETTRTHSVSLSGEPESGTVSTGIHSVTVPSGDIQLGIEVFHPSLSSTLSTSSSSVTAVYPDVIDASGGTTVIDKNISGKDYRIHFFENVGNDTFNVNRAPSGATVDVLIVGGGGGATRYGGGGGGGEVVNGSTSVTPQNYSVKVGDGGDSSDNYKRSGSNHHGDSTSVFGITAKGGGMGMPTNQSNQSFVDANSTLSTVGNGGGGSSRSAGYFGQAGPSVSGFTRFGGSRGGQTDYDGSSINSSNNYPSGGGGGAGGDAVPSGNTGSTGDGGDGGPGVQINFTGENYFWGGGGGGQTYYQRDGSALGGNGGIGGGGGGSGAGTSQGGGSAINPGEGASANSNGGDGGVNTGGGAGAGEGESNSPGGKGGSGIVIIRYEI